jgi:serine/threonine protein kinase
VALVGGSAIEGSHGLDLRAHVPQSAESVLGDRYEIQAILGRGGTGTTTYQAFDRERQETVVLKTIPPDLGGDALENDSLLRAEIKVARRVHHPHVGRVYEYGTHAGVRYIVTELVGGTGLGTAGGEASPGRTEHACRVALQVCEGLEAIHDAGLVHGDLKPSNVMVDAEGVVRLVDFGIAPLLAGAASEPRHIDEYMSPEQSSGQMVDPRSDIYSLGLILFEGITGLPPGPPWREDRVTAALVPVLSRALAFLPEARFATAGAMAAALREAMAPPPSAPPPDAAYAPLARLVAQLANGSANVRWRAALGLTALGPAAAGTVQALVAALDDEDAAVSGAAASALVSVGRAAVAPLLAALDGPRANVRFLAAEALTRMGMVARHRAARW